MLFTDCFYLFLFWRYLNSSMTSFLSDILLPFTNSNDFNSCTVLHLIRWYDKLGDITKGFWEKAIQFHWTFHGLKRMLNTWKVFFGTRVWAPKPVYRSPKWPGYVTVCRQKEIHIHTYALEPLFQVILF